jgi:2-octaprenyl-6-methoxyphenol hydroxylase
MRLWPLVDALGADHGADHGDTPCPLGPWPVNATRTAILSIMSEFVDIAVVGAGPVGLTVASLLAKTTARIVVFEAANDANAWLANDRTLALSAGSERILRSASMMPLHAAKIERIHVSQRGAFGRTVITAKDAGIEALGWVASYAELVRNVPAQLRQRGVDVRFGARVASAQSANDGVRLLFAAGQEERWLHARLVIIADGGGANLFGLAPTIKEYDQSAVLGLVRSSRPLAGTAWERFTRQGPMALLPRTRADRTGHWASLVWTVPTETVPAVMMWSDATFLEHFQAAFGNRAGRFLEVEDRKSFPLRLKTLAQRAVDRVVVIGNAAQTLHPIAGQGLNLGLRDAQTLAESLCDTPRTAWGTITHLEQFVQARSRDAQRTVEFTDFLVQVFERDDIAARAGRSLGLLAFDALPWARQLLAQRMMYGQPSR